MQEFVILLLSIPMISSNISIYDELLDYWDSNNDGIFPEENITMFRHRQFNSTYPRRHHFIINDPIFEVIKVNRNIARRLIPKKKNYYAAYDSESYSEEQPKRIPKNKYYFPVVDNRGRQKINPKKNRNFAESEETEQPKRMPKKNSNFPKDNRGLGYGAESASESEENWEVNRYPDQPKRFPKKNPNFPSDIRGREQPKINPKKNPNFPADNRGQQNFKNKNQGKKGAALGYSSQSSGESEEDPESNPYPEPPKKGPKKNPIIPSDNQGKEPPKTIPKKTPKFPADNRGQQNANSNKNQGKKGAGLGNPSESSDVSESEDNDEENQYPDQPKTKNPNIPSDNRGKEPPKKPPIFPPDKQGKDPPKKTPNVPADNRGQGKPKESPSESKEETEVNHYKGKQCMHGVRKNFGCYSCYCIGGQIIICSSIKCPFIDDKKYVQALKEQLREERCDIYSEIPAPDDCNTCQCLNGKVVCTNKPCGIYIPIEYRHCQPRQWHALDIESDCRSCLCIDGEQSFCYLNYCARKFRQYRIRKIMQLAGPAEPARLEIAPDKKPLSGHSTVDLGPSNVEPPQLNIIYHFGPKGGHIINFAYNSTTGNFRVKIKSKIKAKAIARTRKKEKTTTKKMKIRSEPCEPFQYFNFGSENKCRGCICEEDGTWNCYEVNGACANERDYKCNGGDTIPNPLTPCSLCYCAIDDTYVCTTDENCAYNIRKLKEHEPRTKCDSIKCLNKCRKGNDKQELGVCVKDGCVCLS